MKYQTILFDMDGTILDTLEDLQSSVNHMREKYGYPPCSLDEVRRFVGNGARVLMRLRSAGADDARARGRAARGV